MGRTLGSDIGATVLNQDLYEISAVAKHRLGTRVVRGDRAFRYAKASKTLTKNELAVHPVDLHYIRNAVIPVTAPIGSDRVTVTVHSGDGQAGDGVIAAHEMQGGHVMFYKAGANEWMTFGIVDNTVAASNRITLTLDGELPVALTAAADYCEEGMGCPYYNVNHDNANGTRPFLGMAMRLATVAEPYFWIQTWGPARFAPQAGVGTPANVNVCVFRHDGSIDVPVFNDANLKYAQHAGFVMTRLKNGDQAAPFVFLQVAP